MHQGNVIETQAVRGRHKFSRYKKIIGAFAGFFRLMPRPLTLLCWSWCDVLPGKVGLGIRYSILKGLAKECGDNIYIGQNVEIRGWHNLVIGENVSIHRGCYIDATGGITIGDNVSIAHQSSILSFDHTWEDASRPIRDNPVVLHPVTIDADVWVGCGVRIMSGVHIHTRSVLAAGCVVVRDVPAHTVVGGVPAKPLKQI